jgi:hypothetical protein
MKGKFRFFLIPISVILSFGASLVFISIIEKPRQKKTFFVGFFSFVMIGLSLVGITYPSNSVLNIILIVIAISVIIILTQTFSILGMHEPNNKGNIVFFGIIGTYISFNIWFEIILRKMQFGHEYYAIKLIESFVVAIIVICINLKKSFTSIPKVR